MRGRKEDPAMVHYKKTIEEEKQYAIDHPEEVVRDKKFRELERELNGDIFWEHEMEQEREAMCHCFEGSTPKEMEDDLHGRVQSDSQYRNPNIEMLGWDEEDEEKLCEEARQEDEAIKIIPPDEWANTNEEDEDE